MWSTGSGFGVCAVGNAMMWALDRPTEDKPDWPSVVTVSGPSDKYTDAELETIIEFAKQQTAHYDEMFKYRRGANLVVIDKEGEGRWLRKRMSWYMGPMYSPTLSEALEIFKR